MERHRCVLQQQRQRHCRRLLSFLFLLLWVCCCTCHIAVTFSRGSPLACPLALCPCVPSCVHDHVQPCASTWTPTPPSCGRCPRCASRTQASRGARCVHRPRLLVQAASQTATRQVGLVEWSVHVRVVIKDELPVSEAGSAAAPRARTLAHACAHQSISRGADNGACATTVLPLQSCALARSACT